MTHNGDVCGKGAACEATCPVMLIGRLCPDLPTFLDELTALAQPEESPQLVPEPV